MNILVTGAAGFIGSHLCHKLLELGEEVIGLDNFDPFYSRRLKEKNIEINLSNRNFHFYDVDVRTEDFGLVISNNEVETIYHLAARAGVRPSMNFPQSYVHHDVEATVNLLEVSRKFDISKILFGSSSSVYGNLPDLPYSEDLNLNKPISPYAAAKLSCELFNHVFSDQYGIDITNLRFFTVYGPRQRPEMGIHKFFRLISQNKPIEMYGDGSSSRDYTFISDIVNGLILAKEKMTGYNTYNLGNSNSIILKDLINLIAKTMSREVDVITSESQPGDVDHTLADISKAKREINYAPKISIEEGLKLFWDWFKSENPT